MYEVDLSSTVESTEPCDNCGYQGIYATISTDSGDALCLGCLADDDTQVHFVSGTLGELISIELTDGFDLDGETVENGWIVDGLFGRISVIYPDSKEKDIMSQKTVDYEERVGSYRKLAGDPKVEILQPSQIKLNLSISQELSSTREYINEQRKDSL